MRNHKEANAILRELKRPEHGCTVTRTSANHWKVVKPGCPPVFISSKMGDPHAARNARSDIRRRLGIVL